MNKHDAHARYVEVMRIGAASKADELAAAARARAAVVAAVKETAAAAGVYLIVAAVAYAFWVAV